jgi:uncharacterized protein (DUF169 family)
MYDKLMQDLGLKYAPVGVKLIFDSNQNDVNLDQFELIDKCQRYCEYVRRASQGEFLKLRKGDFTCEIGEIMLGFKKPSNLEFEKRLNFKGLKHVLLFPMNKLIIESVDCILLTVTPKNCMDIIEAYTKIFKRSLKLEIGNHSGVCSDITALVIKKEELNLSFLCPNSRIFAQFDDCELMCGIPKKMIKDLSEAIAHVIQERNYDINLENNHINDK